MVANVSAIGSSDLALAPAGKLPGAAAKVSPTAEFASVLSSMLTDTAHALKAGEAASAAGISGHLPVQTVVESVMQAERSLQTALALRDKAVAAYQEVSRMAI